MTSHSRVVRCIRQTYDVTTKLSARSFALHEPQRRLFSLAFSTSTVAMAGDSQDYLRWTKESLIKRVKTLESELRQLKPNVPAPAADASSSKAPPADPNPVALLPNGKKPKKQKNKGGKLDPSKYSTRPIALKLAYLGKNYNGFEYQPSGSVPTIEEELWKALVRSCLISPEKPDEVDFTPWGYSKCGRTDRGVSAFGQVIGITVRSNRPLPRDEKEHEKEQDGAGEEEAVENQKPAWDPIADEMPYCRILNRLLPPDIRVMAWCPNLPPDFSARFSCRERQYRYFFTQPATVPMPSSLENSKSSGTRIKDGWLDIEAMRDAAKRFEGLHDFRNFCKIDAGKQITNFVRRMFECGIVEVKGAESTLPFLDRPEFRPDAAEGTSQNPKVYYFHVRGSAFLWHQIRHMVAMIFAVGQGLEPPSIVSELLDVEKQPRKPNYNMADEVPLVLWDCIFPDLEDPKLKGNHELEASDVDMEDSIDWLWLGEDNPKNLHGSGGLVDHLWEHWRERKMDELLANRLLDLASSRADLRRRLAVGGGPSKPNNSQRVFEGGNAPKSVGTYIPVLKKQLLASPQEMNDKWAQSKGFANAEEMTKTSNWRSVIKAAKKGGGDGVSLASEE